MYFNLPDAFQKAKEQKEEELSNYLKHIIEGKHRRWTIPVLIFPFIQSLGASSSPLKLIFEIEC